MEARQKRHEFITVEHLLLALLDNPTAAEVLRACAANIEELRKALGDFITAHTPTVAGTEEIDTQPTLGFQRVIQRAILHVQSSGKKEVTGANVLVAIFGEKDSHAVYFLHQQGVTRLDVVNYISHGITKEARAAAQAAIAPILHRHFQRDFDRDRAGLGKEHPRQIARQQRGQPLRQRQRLLMRQPAEHHMRHLLELSRDGFANMRMVVAVAGGPPAGDAVDQLAPVGELDPRALRARHRQRRRNGLHLGIRQPDVVDAIRVPGGRFAVFALFAGHSALSSPRHAHFAQLCAKVT